MAAEIIDDGPWKADAAETMPHPDKVLNIVCDGAAARAEQPQPRWATQRLRRATILAVTRQLIAAHFTHKVTMRMIASAAGVSVPTIHNLIGDRKEVIIRAVNDHTSSLARYVTTTMRSPNFVFAHAESYWHTARVAPDFLRTITLGYAADGDLHSHLLRYAMATVESGLRQSTGFSLLREDVDITRLSMQTSMLISATVQAWAVGIFDLGKLRKELAGVAEGVLMGAVKPSAAPLLGLRRHVCSAPLE